MLRFPSVYAHIRISLSPVASIEGRVLLQSQKTHDDLCTFLGSGFLAVLVCVGGEGENDGFLPTRVCNQHWFLKSSRSAAANLGTFRFCRRFRLLGVLGSLPFWFFYLLGLDQGSGQKAGVDFHLCVLAIAWFLSNLAKWVFLSIRRALNILSLLNVFWSGFRLDIGRRFLVIL